jgi:flavin-dependent dehydrogenase
MDRHFDVCIVGGGPAGLSAACTLIQDNVNVVLIIDPNVRTINAGETLHPNAFNSILKMQLETEFEKLNFDKIAGFESSWGNKYPQFKSAMQMVDGAGWVFNRTAFEDIMLKRFQMKGGTVIAGHFKTNWTNKWKLTSDNQSIKISSSFIVIATGRQRAGYIPLSRKHTIDKLICYTIQVPNQDSDMTVKLDALETGWLYTVKNHNGNRVISFFTDGDIFKEKNFQEITRQLSCLMQHAPSVSKIAKLENGLVNRPIIISSANTTFLEKAYGNAWLACGDCAQTFDPLCSQGISYALASGIEAAHSITEFLSGLTSALQFYELSRTMKFRDYLNHRIAYYNIEKRWQSSKFWARRAEG